MAGKHLNGHTAESPISETSTVLAWTLPDPQVVPVPLLASSQPVPQPACLRERAMVSGFGAKPGKPVLTGKMRTRQLLSEDWGELAEPQ